MLRTLLLNMPFSSLSRPAIGISILKARLVEEGLECHIGYPNLLFAEFIGLDLYELIDEKLSLALFAGEWLFAQHLFGNRLHLDMFISTLRAHLREAERLEEFLSVRGRIGEFLKACVQRFEVERYDIIGFTTTFQQNLASLALARDIKERWPEKIIVFGGANCEGVMGQELQRQFSWIDFVVSGEGDLTFPELVKRRSQGAPLDGLGGLFCRHGPATGTAAPRRVTDMDRLPDPDYTDYFAALEESQLGGQLNPALLIETARGCWWGAKSHCTFCGLNGENMAFRAKSADRVIGELERQVQRHGITRFLAVDNIISYQYFQTLLPRLRDKHLGVSLFYETKANLRRAQVQLLRDAGVLAIQPGIESLSSRVLQLMRKGVSGIQNVYLLKLCREYDIEVAWNLLFGFPGENKSDYDAMAKGMRALYHLKPPWAVAQIRLDRFSPYFDHAQEFGIQRIRPFSLYHLLYPLPPEAVANLAYFFEFEYADGRLAATCAAAALNEAQRWKENDGDLVKTVDPSDGLLIQDTRRGWERQTYLLKGLKCDVYEFCEDIRTEDAISEFVRQRCGGGQAKQNVSPLLDDLVGRGLMFREGRQYLSLAVPPRRNAVSEQRSDVLIGQEIPESLAQCDLLRTGGFMVTSVLSAFDVERLLTEAKRQESCAKRYIYLSGKAAEWRGGNPARAYAVAAGGQVQLEIHAAAATLEALRQIVGVSVALSGGGSYSYYAEPGDFLALHRDVVGCDIALITCLETGPPGEETGRLLLYPGHIHEPLSSVRQAGPEAAVPIQLERGESIVMLGGLVPHEVLPVTARRVVSVVCYRVDAR